jgi:methyl-accepting chemotaxis protein
MQDFKRALSDLADNLDTAGTKIKLEIGVASMTFGTATSALESAITKTKDTVEQLDLRLDQANSLIDNSGEKFEQISTKFFNSLRALDTLVVGVENFVDKIQYNIGTLNKISDSLDHTIESQRHVASDFRDAVPKMVKALSDAVLSIKESTQLTLTSVSALNTEFKNTNKSVDMTVESLTSGVDQYTEKVKDLHLMIDDKIGEAISKIGLAVTTLTKTIDELIDALP